MDKDSLKKNQFWIALGVSGLLLLVSIVLLFIGPASAADKARKDFDAFQKKLKGPADIKNASFNDPWNKLKDKYTKRKLQVWEQAWLTQSDLMTLPPDPKFTNELKNDFRFADKLTPDLLGEYKEKFYDDQFKVAGNLSPERFLAPNGGEWYLPVAYDPNRIFRPVAWKKQLSPSVEEFWLAQEDIWVRREMIKVVREALNSISRFEEQRDRRWNSSLAGVGGTALDRVVTGTPALQGQLYLERTPPAGALKSKLFRSYNWEVNLLLESDPADRRQLQVSPKSTIKNINSARRPLNLVTSGKGLRLRLRQGNAGANLTRIEGLVLQWGDKVEFKAATPASKLRGINLAKDFTLEEVFEPATSPIKVLEQLELGPNALAHRLAQNYKTDLGKVSPKPEEGTTPAPTQTTPMGGMMGGSAPPPGVFGGGGDEQQGGGARAGNADMTPNGLVRNRYLLSNDQVRRLPVAFTVVVDQAYRNEVLAAVANSRLRIQTTQVYWSQREDALPSDPKGSSTTTSPSYFQMPTDPSDPDEEGGTLVGGGPASFPGGGIPPGGVSGAIPPGAGSGAIPPGGGMLPGGGSTGGAFGGQVDPLADANRNLVALTVHGVASLYERYPPREEKTDGTTTTPTKP